MSQPEPAIRVDVSPDGLGATLFIAPDTPRAHIDPMHVQALLAERGIAITPLRVASIDVALANYQPSPQPSRIVIAQGQAPTQGNDGAVEVLPDVLRPALAPEAAPAKGRHTSDHLKAARIVSVRKHQPLGVLRRPTPGTDGVDVRGRAIPATPGRTASVKLDDSVIVKPDGTLLAAHEGVVELTSERLRVSTTLKLDVVDFSTGHVDFPCDVLVMGEVRDGFRLRARRDIEVRGLVDAATIEAGRDLRLIKGMACPKAGTLTCGRDLIAACLNNVTVQVGRDATIEKELLDCRLVVWRRLIAPGAAMVRGEATLAGGAELGSVGCESFAETLLYIGHAPQIDRLSREAGRLTPAIVERRDQASRRLDELAQQKATSHKIAEQQTELRFVIDSAASLAAKLGKGCDTLLAWTASQTRAELIARREIFPGVKVVLGLWTLEFRTRVAGPVKLSIADAGEPTISDLAVGRSYPASDVARVTRGDHTPDIGLLLASLRGGRDAA